MANAALLNNFRTVFDLGLQRLVECVLPREVRSLVDRNMFADQARVMSEQLCAKVETNLNPSEQQRVAAKTGSVAESMITDRKDFDELNKTYELVQQALVNVTGRKKEDILEDTLLETDLQLDKEQLGQVLNEYLKLIGKPKIDISNDHISDASLYFELTGEDFNNQSILELAANIDDIIEFINSDNFF